MNDNILDSGIIENKIVYQDNLTTIERLKSMLLDHIIICFTILPFFMILTFVRIGMDIENELLNKITMFLIFGIYLNKDLLRGRSAAKRILGQIVIDNETNKPANELKCAIRNFTDIFWIVEVVIVMFNPNRRIGDLIANTKVVRTEKVEIKTMLEDIQSANKLNWITAFGIALVYMWIVFYFTDRLILGI